MKLYVHQHPNDSTLAECVELPDDAPAPADPFVLMTPAELADWADAERTVGWAPVFPDPPPSPWDDLIQPDVDAVASIVQARSAMKGGGTIAIALPAVPETITTAQMRIALTQFGICDSMIDPMIDSLPEPQKTLARARWQMGTSVDRGSSFVSGLCTALGLADDQIDDVFRAAGQI
jgi:hypothetical protein